MLGKKIPQTTKNPSIPQPNNKAWNQKTSTDMIKKKNKQKNYFLLIRETTQK